MKFEVRLKVRGVFRVLGTHKVLIPVFVTQMRFLENLVKTRKAGGSGQVIL